MMKTGTGERFWRWLHSYAERRIRRIHMDAWKHDRVCQGCKQWGALCGWSASRTIDDWHDGLTCATCGHETVWFMGAMLPIPAEVAGTTPSPSPAPPLWPGRPQP
jgi:hypothetical protein